MKSTKQKKSRAPMPQLLPVYPERIPRRLIKEQRWVVWRLDRRNKRWAKIPYNALTGKLADSTDSATWCDFLTAWKRYERNEFDGLGFVLGDGWAGVDLDNCINPESGEIASWADDIIERLQTYSEISPSGTGVKLFCRGNLPDGRRRKGNIEMYDTGRYFTVTGQCWESQKVAKTNGRLTRLHNDIFAEERAEPTRSAKAVSSSVGEIIERARIGKNGEKFRKLFDDGDASDYASGSEADLGLCSMIASYTGRNAQLIHEVFCGSALYRKKWERQDYRDRTIDKVLEGTNASYGSRRAKMTRASDIQPVPVKWVWPGRIPRGKLTLLIGFPGLGKSFVSLDIAARISNGDVWPDVKNKNKRKKNGRKPADVIILSAEDDAADTIVPRLEDAGADLDRIQIFEGIQVDDDENIGHFILKRDLKLLEQAIERIENVKLLIVDPLNAYSSGVDTHKDAEVREVLSPLTAMAARQNVAVLAVTHIPKAKQRAVHSAVGSQAFVAASRAAWVIGPDPNDQHRRLMAAAKMNLAEMPSGLAFQIAPPGTVEWETDEIQLTADEILSDGGGSGRTEKRIAINDAENFLKQMLSDGPVSANDIFEQGKDAGVSKRTLQRAKKNLGVEAKRVGGWNIMSGNETPKGMAGSYTTVFAWTKPRSGFGQGCQIQRVPIAVLPRLASFEPD